MVKKKAAAPPPVSTYKKLEIRSADDGWVKISLKLVNWTFDNATITLRASAPLHSIVRRIQDKHGHVKDLCLYKGQVNPTNLMEDFSASLASLGFEGVDDPNDAKPKTIYFDFMPILEPNPLLLVTPRTY